MDALSKERGEINENIKKNLKIEKRSKKYNATDERIHSIL